MRSPLIAFPEHALLVVEERLREQRAEGVRMPERMELDELALRVLIVAEASRMGREAPMRWRGTRRGLA